VVPELAVRCAALEDCSELMDALFVLLKYRASPIRSLDLIDCCLGDRFCWLFADVLRNNYEAPLFSLKLEHPGSRKPTSHKITNDGMRALLLEGLRYNTTLITELFAEPFGQWTELDPMMRFAINTCVLMNQYTVRTIVGGYQFSELPDYSTLLDLLRSHRHERLCNRESVESAIEAFVGKRSLPYPPLSVAETLQKMDIGVEDPRFSWALVYRNALIGKRFDFEQFKV
jgi:hypothetical protein